MENMKNCLILINQNAGSSRKISFAKVEKCLGDNYAYTEITLPCIDIPTYDYYDTIAICGGDGTLSNIMKDVHDKNIDVYFFPVGTLNDKAKANKHKHLDDDFKKLVIGKIQNENIILHPKDNGNRANLNILTNLDMQESKNENTTLTSSQSANANQDIFTYVFACGSFTPIGYCSNVKTKKKLGILAYVANIIREYKPYKIHAKIDMNKKQIEDDFTLIMLLKSPRCFGFNFNKDFDAKSESGHLIAIRSPKHKNVLGYIEMFFPFFRVFFVGLKKQPRSKNIIFESISNIKIELKENTTFCRDGEKHLLEKGALKINFEKTKCNFHIVGKF